MKEVNRINLQLNPAVLSLDFQNNKIWVGNDYPAPEQAHLTDQRVTVDVYSLDTGERLQQFLDETLERPTLLQGVKHLCVDNDRGIFFSGHSSMGGVRMWWENSEKASKQVSHKTGADFIEAMCLTKDDLYFVDHLWNQYKYNLNAADIVEKNIYFDEDHQDSSPEVKSLITRFSKSGNYLATAIEKKAGYFLCLKKTMSDTVMWEMGPLEDQPTGLIISPCETKLFLELDEGQFYVLDLKSGEITTQRQFQEAADLLKISPDGSMLVRLFNTAKGFARLKNPKDLALYDSHSLEVVDRTKVDPGSISDLVISPDNQKLYFNWAARVDGQDFNQIIQVRR